MKKVFLICLLVKLLNPLLQSQTYCLAVQKVSSTATSLTVKFILSSSSATVLTADASFIITGTGGISGTEAVGGSATGSFTIGNGQSYQVANLNFNPSGTYTFQVANNALPATFNVNDSQGDGLGVTIPQWIPRDAGCPINDIVLPVELLSFKAEKKSGKTLVEWEAIQEKNLDNYIIERSEDGKNFKPLGFEKPKAKSEVEKAAYSFVDEQPEIGINYYRLQSKGVRKEDFKYSKVVSVDFGLGLKAKAFPNPFAAELSIELDIEQGVKGEVTIDMFDTAGKQVLNKKITAEGRKLVFEVPTEGLVLGSYVIRVKNGSYTWQHKITKQ